MNTRVFVKVTLPLLSLAVIASAIVAGCSGGGGGGKAIVTSLYPPEGADVGGTTVLVIGSGFGSPASVIFGDVAGTDVQVLSKNQISVKAPPHAVVGTDVAAVDVQVRTSGHVVKILAGYQYVNSNEVEPNGSGDNDTFATYRRIPLDVDYHGFIGELGDIDVLHLHTPANGQVLLTVTFDAAYTSGGLAGMTVDFYHGPDPSPNPDAYFGGSIAAIGTGPTIPKIDNWLRMSYVNDGHGPFIVVKGVSDVPHSGFDPVHPYTIHATFIPDVSIEPAPAADGFQAAAFLSTDYLMDTANYDQDFDWYAFVPQKSGWVRVVSDASQLGQDPAATELDLNAKLFLQDPTDPNKVQSISGAEIAISDKPGTYAGVMEYAGLSSNLVYYLRLYNTNLPGGPTGAYQYPVIISRGDGNFESLEPSGLLPAESENAPNDLGSLLVTQSVTPTGYFFHEADKDFFKVHVTGPATLSVTLNHAKISGQIGSYDATLNPLGGGWGLLVFNSFWFNQSGHLATPDETVPWDAANISGTAYDFTSSPTTKTVSVNVPAGGDDYYILAEATRGFSLTSSYSLSVVAGP